MHCPSIIYLLFTFLPGLDHNSPAVGHFSCISTYSLNSAICSWGLVHHWSIIEADCLHLQIHHFRWSLVYLNNPLPWLHEEIFHGILHWHVAHQLLLNRFRWLLIISRLKLKYLSFLSRNFATCPKISLLLLYKTLCSSQACTHLLGTDCCLSPFPLSDLHRTPC